MRVVKPRLKYSVHFQMTPLRQGLRKMGKGNYSSIYTVLLEGCPPISVRKALSRQRVKSPSAKWAIFGSANRELYNTLVVSFSVITSIS